MNITIEAINGYYYDVEYDWDDIYNSNIREEQFHKLDMENVSKVTLDDHATHIGVGEVYFTIDLDCATMELSPEYETENLKKMGNPPIVPIITEGEPVSMWNAICEITDSVSETDDPDMCYFIVGSDMYHIDDCGVMDDVMKIVEIYQKQRRKQNGK